jgi:hypothetical protein
VAVKDPGRLFVASALRVFRDPGGFSRFASLLAAIAVLLGLAACSPERDVSLSLSPVPFAMKVPPGIAPQLVTGPIEGPFGEQVRQAGAAAATTVYYNPVGQGERVIFMTAYWFPADKFDALQAPDQPPLFGTEVLRQDGHVLSMAGPVDAIFAPDTPDGRNLTALYGVIYLPETYRANE